MVAGRWRAHFRGADVAAPGGGEAATLFGAILAILPLVDCVTRAGSAGTESGSCARFLVLLTMLAPVVAKHTGFRGPASSYSSTSDDESNSKIADGYGTPRAAQLVMA